MKYKLFLLVLLFSFHNCFAQTDTAAVRLNDHRDKVFTVFNTCRSQEDNISEAVKAKKINEIETGTTALLQCAIAGMKQLDSIKDFDGDPALKFSCRDVLKFYKELAESDLPKVKDFFVQEEKFFAIKKQFEKKPAKKHSDAEILAYNNEVKKYNAALQQYSQLNSFITNSRKLTLNNWYSSVKIFMDSHTRKL
jgi:hypothetical protein